MTNTTLWLVYDHQEHKWLTEYNHPTNYVDEASRFTREEAEKLVADAAGKPWIDGKPPRVMVPDTRAEHEHLGLAGQAQAVWKLVEAATEQMIADRPSKTTLADRARAAYEEADAHYNDSVEYERRNQVGVMREMLAKYDIEPVGEPFTNWVSNRVCLPLVKGGWDDETETQIHTVAVEWDYEARELGLSLVADGDVEDYDFNVQRLYPAGRLDELADIGRAMAKGGRKPTATPTAADAVRRALTSVSGDYIDDKAAVFLSGCEAISEALLDIADAIREGR